MGRGALHTFWKTLNDPENMEKGKSSDLRRSVRLPKGPVQIDFTICMKALQLLTFHGAGGPAYILENT